MLNLNKTTSLIAHEIENDLYLLELLKEDLVNISALARRVHPIIKKKNRKATIESISIAIRRYIQMQKKQKQSKELQQIISGCQLMMKNDIVHITFERNAAVSSLIETISSKIRWDQDEVFYVNQGAGEVTLVIDEKNVHLTRSAYRYVINTKKHASILCIKEGVIQENKLGMDVPGLYAFFINNLARHSINLYDVVSTMSQLTVIIPRSQLMTAYEVINTAIQHNRENQKK